MRAFNKKKKPKHTTKAKIVYSEYTYWGKLYGRYIKLSLNIFTESKSSVNPFFEDVSNVGLYKFGRLIKSRVVAIRKEGVNGK